MKYFFALCAIAAASFTIGCKSSTEPPTPAVIPHVGSFYTFYETYVDSMGTMMASDTLTMQIVADNSTYLGFTNVTKILETTNRITGTTHQIIIDTAYYTFLSDGSFIEEIGAQFPQIPKTEWLNFPFTYGEVYTFSQMTPTDTVIITTEQTSYRNVSYHGKSIAMNQVIENIYVSPNPKFLGAATSVSRLVDYNGYLGVIGPSTDLSNQINGTSGLLRRQTLVDYLVK